MALADGKLPPAEAPRLVHDLYHSPELVSELQAYLATSPVRMSPAYQAIGQAPVPKKLISTIMNYAPSTPPAKRSSPFAALQGLADRLKQTYDVRGWSLAAGPALAGTVVAVFAWLLMPTSSVGALVDANLGRALDNTASGAQTAVVAVAPILSFKNKSAELCRQYDVVYSARQASHAVACRSKSGEWKVVLATPLAAIGTFLPAGPASRKPVDDFVSANSTEDLDGQREAEELGKR
jgi:hypothetical protein